jgi:hypothetical protein
MFDTNKPVEARFEDWWAESIKLAHPMSVPAIEMIKSTLKQAFIAGAASRTDPTLYYVTFEIDYTLFQKLTAMQTASAAAAFEVASSNDTCVLQDWFLS